MHLIFVVVLLVCAVAYPLPIVVPPAPVDEELGRLAHVLETPLLPLTLTSASVNGGDFDQPNGFGRHVSPIVRDVLVDALVIRAVTLAALQTSTSQQVIIPPTPPRTSLYPLPTSAQLPSHTQLESTAEKTSSILATPHTSGEALSIAVTATVTATSDGDGDSGDSDSGSDPSTPTPTSTDSSNPSQLATILGSVFGGVIFIGMIVVFIIWWRRT